MGRPSLDMYFMSMASLVAMRSTCLKRKVGAVLVRDKMLISTGYNETPRALPNCGEGGCSRCASNVPSGVDLGECLCVHAEQNAIVQAAYHGISTQGATLYTSVAPCLTCAKLIINAGISRVIYYVPYIKSDVAFGMLTTVGIKVELSAPTLIIGSHP